MDNHTSALMYCVYKYYVVDGGKKFSRVRERNFCMSELRASASTSPVQCSSLAVFVEVSGRAEGIHTAICSSGCEMATVKSYLD